MLITNYSTLQFHELKDLLEADIYRGEEKFTLLPKPKVKARNC
jgi:hypothetical protein